MDDWCDPEKRPEYVHCVLTGRVNDRESWCRRTVPYSEWTFSGWTHASLTAWEKCRMLICLECANALSRLLLDGTVHGAAQAPTENDLARVNAALSDKSCIAITGGKQDILERLAALEAEVKRLGGTP